VVRPDLRTAARRARPAGARAERAGLHEGIGWLRAHLLGDERLPRAARVRVFVTGERAGGGWRELASWPPPGSGERRLWLADGARLQDVEPAEDAGSGDRYRYDPADPTPSLGGPVLLAREPVLDNSPLESREDVLTYTSAPLRETEEAIGRARVELYVSASSPYFDVFARVCDVDADGASWNVCDALARVAPERFDAAGDGAVRVAFDLWPLGHRFAAGHRIRLQVSSGAHARYAQPGHRRGPRHGDGARGGRHLRAGRLTTSVGARAAGRAATRSAAVKPTPHEAHEVTMRPWAR
jgi:putative CocE/NonD family hydrolase